VIVVDDYEDSIELLEYYLELFGIKAIARGGNGLEAALLYQKLRPDYVFLDLSMPDFDGFYGLVKIKQFNPFAKVIITTADLSSETRHKLAILGATDILYKPVEEQVMKQIIMSHNDLRPVNLNVV
jgi:CheY-like chemotaxis protein